ncbi:MAG: glycosyltransferase family 10 [Armatimonadota bacterium]|nr:glycosyltransferase family 10 [Armatimonadota bacterium]
MTDRICRGDTLCSPHREVYRQNGKPVVFIEPYTHLLLDDKLFDNSESLLNRDGVLDVWTSLKIELRKEGIEAHTTDFIPAEERDDVVFIVNTVNSDSKLHERLGSRNDICFGSYYLPEPPVDASFNARSPYRRLDALSGIYRRVYASPLSDAIGELKNVPTEFSARQFFYPNSPSGPLDEYWGNRDRKFLVMINSPNYSPMRQYELYSERIRALDYFGERSLIDLYGHRWREACLQSPLLGLLRIARRPSVRSFGRWLSGLQTRRAAKHILNAYKGTCGSKYDTLSQYHFALAYENFRIRGYITEKMLDCLFVGTIPVYWGEPEIEKWVPKECYIDRREFTTYADLHAYLQSLTEDDRMRYREAGKAFVESESFYPFSKEAFAESFIADVKEDLEAIDCAAGQEASVAGAARLIA